MKIMDQLKSATPDVLMVTGAGAVSYGIGMVYPPAGCVAAGIFLLVAGWLSAKGK